jgi:hypothetical protein
VSFAGMGFLAFYLAGKMHLADAKGHRVRTSAELFDHSLTPLFSIFRSQTRAWLALSPLLASTMVAVSRTADNRHHWQDVTVGSLLGLGIGTSQSPRHFPSADPVVSQHGSHTVHTSVRLLSNLPHDFKANPPHLQHPSPDLNPTSPSPHHTTKTTESHSNDETRKQGSRWLMRRSDEGVMMRRMMRIVWIVLCRGIMRGSAGWRSRVLGGL